MFRKILTVAALAAVAGLVSCVKYQTEADYVQHGPSSYHVYTDDDVVKLPAHIGDTSILIRSNVSWEGTNNSASDWITMTPPIRSDSDGYAYFDLVPNVTGADRMATITVKATGDESYFNTFQFLQVAATSPFATLKGLAPHTRADGNVRLLKSGGEVAFTLSSNVGTTLTPDADWCRIIRSGTEYIPGDDPVLTLNPNAMWQLEISVDENLTGDVRTASIVVTNSDDGTAFATIHIFQVQTDDPNVPILYVVNGETIEAHWDAVSGATDYTLLIDDMSGNSVAVCGGLKATSLDITDMETLTGNTAYPDNVKLTVTASGISSNVVVTGTRFHSGDGSAADPYILTSVRHINNINAILKRDIYYCYKLGANIDYQGTAFTPIGTANIGLKYTDNSIVQPTLREALPTGSKPFVGSFDGANYTISNSSVDLSKGAYINAANKVVSAYYGFFGVAATILPNMTYIRNLTFSNCSIIPPTGGQMFMGNAQTPSGTQTAFSFCTAVNKGATITNVHAVNCILDIPAFTASNDPCFIGAIVGDNTIDNPSDKTPGIVSSCGTSSGRMGGATFTTTHSGNNNNNTWYYGGVAGMNDGGCLMQFCTNESTTVYGGSTAGGVAGVNLGNMGYCTNKASVAACNAAGGIAGGAKNNTFAGYLPVAGTSPRIEYCWNAGRIDIYPGNGNLSIGGIAGRMYGGSTSTINFCYNSGAIVYNLINEGATAVRPTSGAGGIAGVVNWGAISNCYNGGTVYNSVNFPSGGYTSIVSDKLRFGGIVAMFTGEAVTGTTPGASSITNCYSVGAIDYTAAQPMYQTSGDYSTYGVLVGATTTALTATHCYYLSDILTNSPNITAGVFNVADAPGVCESKSSDDLKQETTFSGWDFSSANAWIMSRGSYLYPVIDGVGE